MFIHKGLNSNKLMLGEKDVVVSDGKALATLMNNYCFIAADLESNRDSENFCETPTTVYNIKKKVQDHQSILNINKTFNVTDLFSFHEITDDKIQKEISKLNGFKATLVDDISVEQLKSTIHVHASLLTKIINSSIQNGCFPDTLEVAVRSVSVLPHVSQVFERIMYIQIKNFMEVKSSKLVRGFSKTHSTQPFLVNMLE